MSTSSGKNAAEATTRLHSVSPPGASEPVLKVLESAIANAKADKTAGSLDRA